MSLYGKDLITICDWKKDELDKVLNLAKDIKKNRFSPKYINLLNGKTFLMVFYNPSLRTRISFEAAMTELGGHSQFLEPGKMRVKLKGIEGETVKDSASVMARYAHGIGIRILEDAVEKYGDGDLLLREYAKYSDVPIINMADDVYHPCQALADIMGVSEHLGDVKGKKLIMMWGYSPKMRSWCSIQSNLLISSRFGMNVTLAHPQGFDLDPNIITTCKKYALESGGSFEITHNLEEAFKGADVVYSRNWMSSKRYEIGDEAEKASYEKYKDWRCTKEFMKLTNDAYFIHPMPVDRGNEVDDEVVDSPRSIIYDIAENRLHVQKAVMILTMSK
ncbi:MAG: ornithine carbamoyltransferase [Actinobacteria bacterium]|nr:ornithine carbamoyltransferase [Actinomycetota bacterium]